MDFHVEFEFWLRAGRTEQNTTVYKSELQHIGRWQTVPTIRIIPNVLYGHASQCLRRRLSQRSKLGLHAFHPVRPRNAPNKLTVFVPAVGCFAVTESFFAMALPCRRPARKRIPCCGGGYSP